MIEIGNMVAEERNQETCFICQQIRLHIILYVNKSDSIIK